MGIEDLISDEEMDELAGNEHQKELVKVVRQLVDEMRSDKVVDAIRDVGNDLKAESEAVERRHAELVESMAMERGEERSGAMGRITQELATLRASARQASDVTKLLESIDKQLTLVNEALSKLERPRRWAVSRDKANWIVGLEAK